MIRFFLLWFAALLVAVPADAQNFPRLTGRVVDQANLLDPAREAALAQKLADLERASGRQLVVATIASLEGRPIEDYGYRLGREWGIGSAEKDDGVLLIVAPNEKRVRIETGYGARVFLTDALSSVIVRNAIVPRFRENDFPGGIEAGVAAISEQMQLPPAEAARRISEAEQGERAAPRGSGGAGIFPAIFAFMVIAIMLLAMSRRARGRKYRGKRRRGDGIDPVVVLWGLDVLGHAMRGGGGGGGGWSDGGGGGFSGGGGSFGGGGASGSW